MKNIALITGKNRGIGFELFRQLAEKDFKVVLTSRSEKSGLQAVNKLRNQGLDVDYL